MTISQDEIKARAIRLGFSFIGFTPAEQTPHFSQYVDFISNHALGDLVFLSKPYVITGRENPATLLDNAKTIIILGVCYPSINKNRRQYKNTDGAISSYAVLPDYHNLLREKATALMKELELSADTAIHWRIFIDSGPMMEKDMAYAAGLGWIGKNAVCIHPDYGSFFFICCVLTDLGLKQNKIAPVRDLCGDCELCVQACPTGCINDHQIDVTRCISYLTTEHNGIIPRNLRSQIGNHIFGCDICQSDCPHNQANAKPENGLIFHINHLVPTSLCLPDELNHTPESFKNYFRGTSILRIGVERYLRNVIIAAGNSRNARCVPALKRLVSHHSDLVAIHAAWALSMFSDRNLNRYLIRMIDTEISELTANEIRALVLD